VELPNHIKGPERSESSRVQLLQHAPLLA